MTGPQDPNSPEYRGLPPMPPVPDDRTRTPKPPTEVTVSFWIWIVGSALVAMNAVLTLVVYRDRTLGVLVQSFQQNKTSGITEAQFRDTASTALIIVLVIFLALVALAVFLANRMRAGRNGARIGLTAIAIVVVLLMLLGGTNTAVLITVLVPIVATVLMYLPNSTAFFQGRNQR